MINYERISPVTGERGENMKCKYCSAELDENMRFCPACGKKQKQPAKAPVETDMTGAEVSEVSGNVWERLKKWQRITAITVAAALLLALFLWILTLCGVRILPRKNDIFKKDSYTVSDKKAEQKLDVVVATMGSQTLTNGELQAYYWQGVFDFLSSYNYDVEYLYSMGFDLYLPFEDQIYNHQTGMTFQQMFLQNALNTWQRYACLNLLAEEANFKLSEEEQEFVNGFYDGLEEEAKKSGYTNAEEYLDKEMFPGCSVESYFNFYYDGYFGLAYYDIIYEEMMPTETELEDFYKENEAKLKENKIDKESGYYYDVRHILIKPQGEKVDGAYTESQWETCRQAAQKILDEYLNGDKTEKSFSDLAEKHSEDSSKDQGGMLGLLTKDSSLVEEFKNWYLESSRKNGDTGLVKSVYGYHVMYLFDKVPIWEYECRSAILSERTVDLLTEVQEEYPMEVDYKKIVLGYVNMYDM